MQTINEALRIARRKESIVARKHRPRTPVSEETSKNPFAEPKGIRIRIIEEPNAGEKSFAQIFSNGEGRPPYLQIPGNSYTPSLPNYFNHNNP